MEYTVQKLSQLAGVSTRTLRYYDEINILSPARINSSGYRIYGEKEVDRLQQILFYRELEVSLEDIKKIINEPSFDRKEALKEHQQQLIEKRKQLDLLIANVEKTLAQTEGRSKMSNQEKFKGFKQKMVEDNEKTYGREIREKYGEETVNRSNDRLKNMTEEEYKEVKALEKSVKEVLAAAFATGNPAGELAQKAADLHKQWLTYYWSDYSKEAHVGLTNMYVQDERFRAYYDEEQPGMAEFLRDAVLFYTGVRS
jgi:DNA-binding transcriptional MerR regulator